MINNKNIYRIEQVKSSLKGNYAILTSGSKNIANVAMISDVEVMNNNNDLILQITGNIKDAADGIFINVEGVFYKLSFEIISSDISKSNLESYMLCHDDKIKTSYDLFEFCRFKGKVKQTRLSATGGVFLNWYNDGRVTNTKISAYDGIWISGKYIRVIVPVPPSLEFSISEVLFEEFNDSNPFTSIGSYKVCVPGTTIVANDSYYDEYITINGIVIPDIKSYKSVTNEKIVAIDREDKEFVIYHSKKNISENIA
jgi:hypothetical protein